MISFRRETFVATERTLHLSGTPRSPGRTSLSRCRVATGVVLGSRQASRRLGLRKCALCFGRDA